jgi:hypothetical protein
MPSPIDTLIVTNCKIKLDNSSDRLKKFIDDDVIDILTRS